MLAFVYDIVYNIGPGHRGLCGRLSPVGRRCDRILGHTGRHHVTGGLVSDAPGERRFWVAEVWS